MNRFGLGLCVTIACGQASCLQSSVETTPLNAPPRALSERSPSSVEVYTSSPPSRPHVDVALLRAKLINYTDPDTPKMVASLVEQAARMGCDAIFVSGSSERQSSPTDLQLIETGTHEMLATCMAYLPASSDPAALVAPSNSPANAVVLVQPEAGPPPTKPPALVSGVSTGSAPR